MGYLLGNVWSGGASPVVTPAWLSGTPLNEWVQITDTSGAGGAAIAAYSGMALNRSTSEIIVAAAGGHQDSSDNRVVGLDLSADAPSWTTRKAASAAGDVVTDEPYYSDGTPSARHTYWTTQYISQRSRVMLFGAYAPYGPGVTTQTTVDGFDLDTNAWDAAGTWDDILAAQLAQCQDHDTGDVYSVANSGVYKWNQATQTQSLLHDFNSGVMSMGLCWDPGRSQLFSIGFGIGRDPDGSSDFAAYKIAADGLTRTAITFNSSAAYTQFLAERPFGFGLDYDPDNDRFLLYAGGLSGATGAAVASGNPADIYDITPNSGSTWDMSLLSLGAGSSAPAASGTAGVFNRFQRVPLLKGFVNLNSASGADISFIRTA